MARTLTNTWRVNLPKSNVSRTFFAGIFIPSAEDWAWELRDRNQAWPLPKPQLLHQMALSATSMMFLLQFAVLNGSKNVKSVRSTILLLVCQRETVFLYTSAYDMDMRKVWCLCSHKLSSGPGLSWLSLCAAIFLYEWKRKQANNPWPFYPAYSRLQQELSSHLLRSLPSLMVAKVGANHCESCVI